MQKQVIKQKCQTTEAASTPTVISLTVKWSRCKAVQEQNTTEVIDTSEAFLLRQACIQQSTNIG